MGVTAINTSRTFKITRENVKKILDNLKDITRTYYEEDDSSIKDVFETIGWEIQSSRQEGVTKICRDECLNNGGWIRQEEFEFFSKLAPYVENGSYIEFETIYGGSSYTKWSFEDGKLIYYTGKQEIKWAKNDKPSYR